MNDTETQNIKYIKKTLKNKQRRETGNTRII